MGRPEPYTVWFYFPTEAAAKLAADELAGRGHVAGVDHRTGWTVCAWSSTGGPWPKAPWPTYATEAAAREAAAQASSAGCCETQIIEPNDDEWLARASTPRDWDLNVDEWWAPFYALAEKFGGICDGTRTRRSCSGASRTSRSQRVLPPPAVCLVLARADGRADHRPLELVARGRVAEALVSRVAVERTATPTSDLSYSSSAEGHDASAPISARAPSPIPTPSHAPPNPPAPARKPRGTPMVRTTTPGIYKRGSRYVFSYRVSGVQRWETCRTLEQARRAKAARSTDIDRGEFEPRSRVTLHEYVREWIERYQGTGRRGFREETRTEYRRQIERYALAYFAEQLRLTDVTPSKMAAFVGWLCDPTEHDGVELADSTVRRIVAPLSTCLATTRREGLIRHNPRNGYRLPHRPRLDEGEDDEVRALTSEQLETFMRVVGSRWRTLFHVLAVTGLRISEAIGLQWRHVQLDGSKPHVKVRRRIVGGEVGPPKSRYARRDVRIPQSLVLRLRQMRAQTEWPGDTDPVLSSITGTPMSYGNLFRRVLKPEAEEAGVPWAAFHAFRHTCASRLFAAGWNVVQVQRLLGHHSPSFTVATYVHLLSDDLGEPLDLLIPNKDVAAPSRLSGPEDVNIDANMPPMAQRHSEG